MILENIKLVLCAAGLGIGWCSRNRGNPIHIMVMVMVIYELPEQVSTEASIGFLTWSTNVFKNFPNYTFPYYLPIHIYIYIYVHLQTTTTEEIVVNFWSLFISNITYKKFYISKHFATFSPFLVVIVYEEHTNRNSGHPKKCQMVSVFFPFKNGCWVMEWLRSLHGLVAF